MGELDTIESAIEAIRAGRMIIVVDDDDRENEGDLIMAAATATPEQVAFMVRHTSGILCTPVTAADAARLRLQPMVSVNDAPLQTAFTVSVDYRYGLTTGISAEERTGTIRALANRNVGPEDFVRPGHIFPLLGRDGGVLIRSGHTEAALDLCRLAGVETVGVLAELVNDDGTVKRLPACLEFARAHDLRIVSIADLIEYRQRRDQLVRRVATFEAPTPIGPATAVVYATPFDPIQHVALVFGDLGGGERVPARIHREQPIGDVLGGGAGDIPRALARIGREGRGVFLLLRDTVVAQPASDGAGGEGEGHESAQRRMRQWREVGIGAQILRDLGIVSIHLLAAHRRHYIGLSGFGIEIAETELLEPAS
jgi:3,4-dihydroxy 2-butanone 4-phosphate synthase / GTP cyclohydrolase II